MKDTPGKTSALSPSGMLFLLCSSVGVATIGLGILWPLVPVYALELGATGFQVGMIIASFNIARTLMNPVAGRLSDRWGRKRFIVLGLFCYAMVSMCYIQADSVEALILVRVFHGLTSVLVVPIAMALTADIAPDYRLGKYMGTLNMAVMLGLGAGPIIGGLIRDMLGMAAAFYTMGGLALLTLFAVLFFLPETEHESGARKRSPAASFREQIRHRSVQGLFLMRFFVAAGQGSVYTFLPLLALEIDLTSSQVGIVLGVNVFFIAILQRICGNIADRFNPLVLITSGTILSGAAVLVMPAASGFVQVLALNIVMGGGNGIAMPAGFLLTGRLGRKMGMASVMGITDSGWSLGMIVSPILSGIIMDHLGMFYVFLIGGLLVVVGAVAVYFFLRNSTENG
jgi:MFS transporter, DHA1 family, multidrug resistance protein